MAIGKATEQQLGHLQMMEQNLQQFSIQKQQFQSQLVEIDSALDEIKDKVECYRIIGSVMVSSERAGLEKDLKSKKEILELRIKTVEKQEDKIRDKAKQLQQDILKELGKADKNGTAK